MIEIRNYSSFEIFNENQFPSDNVNRLVYLVFFIIVFVLSVIGKIYSRGSNVIYLLIVFYL